MSESREKIINDLTEIQTSFFDEESKLLGSIDEKIKDYYGNKMRRIAELRKYQSTIVDAIEMIKHG